MPVQFHSDLIQLVLATALIICCCLTGVAAEFRRNGVIDIYDYLAGDEDVFDLDCGDETSPHIHVLYYGDVCMVYAPLYKKTCQLRQIQPTIFEIYIDKNDAAQCGIKRAGNSATYYIDLLVQETMVRQSTDTVHTITCNYEKGMVEMVHHTTDEGAIQRIPEMGGIGGYLSVIIELYIRDRNDKIIEQTLLGDPIHLDAQVGNASTGIRAWNCWATDGTNDTSAIYRLLQSGCGDGEILPRSQGFMTRGDITWGPQFAAFALPGATRLQILCDFVVCENTTHCDGPSCTEFGAPSKVEHPTRQRRDAAESIQLVRASTALSSLPNQDIETTSGENRKARDLNLKVYRAERDTGVENASDETIDLSNNANDRSKGRVPEQEPVIEEEEDDGAKVQEAAANDGLNDTAVASSQVVQILDFQPVTKPGTHSTLHPMAAEDDDGDVIMTTQAPDETTAAAAMPGVVEVGQSMSNGGLLLPIIAALAGMGLLIFFLVAVAIFLWYRNRKKRIMLEQLRPWPPANVSHQPGSPTGHALLLGSPEGSLLPPILKPISEVPDSATCPSTSNSAQNAYQREVYVRYKDAPMPIDLGGNLVLNNIRAVVDDRGQIYSVDEIRSSLLQGDPSVLDEVPQQVRHLNPEEEEIIYASTTHSPVGSTQLAHVSQQGNRVTRHVSFPDLIVDQAPEHHVIDINMPRPRLEAGSILMPVLPRLMQAPHCATDSSYREFKTSQYDMHNLADPWTLMAPNENRGSSRSVNEGDLDGWVSSESLPHLPTDEPDSSHSANALPPIVIPYQGSPQPSGVYESSIHPRVGPAGLSGERTDLQRSSSLADLWYQYIMNAEPVSSSTGALHTAV